MNISPETDEQERTGTTRGLVMINTGNGKGKTTAAMGQMMRAWGHGKKVIMFQFIKNSGADFGEHRAARKMGIEIIAGGAGFAMPGVTGDTEESERRSQELWDLASAAILSGDYDMVVLDELTWPLRFGWLDADVIITTLENRPASVHVIITGRDAPEKLLGFADTVTEAVETRHHFRQGIKAQPGIEF